MSEFFFGLGRGHLPKQADRIAKKHNSHLVNYTDPGCSCGRGCSTGCKSNRKHWFATTNRGEPFNSQTATVVISELEKAKILKSGNCTL